MTGYDINEIRVWLVFEARVNFTQWLKCLREHISTSITSTVTGSAIQMRSVLRLDMVKFICNSSHIADAGLSHLQECLLKKLLFVL